MAANVYFWNSNKDEWGHLSLQLSNGTYISHWPEESKTMKNLTAVPAKQMRNLAYDVFAEKRNPDQTVELIDEMLNEDKITNYWNEFKVTSTTKYHFVTTNCARVVLSCIELGLDGKDKSSRAWEMAEEEFRRRIHMIGATSGTDMADVTTMLGYSNMARTTPSDVLEIVKFWREAFQNVYKTRKNYLARKDRGMQFSLHGAECEKEPKTGETG